MKKIIFINLIVIFLLFGILEFISYIYIKKDAESYMVPLNKALKESGEPLQTQRYAPVRVFNQNQTYPFLRKINYGNKDKFSILFFGCSYTYGTMEKEENTIPYLINKKTNITTVNQAYPGSGILNTLYDLNNPKFYERIKSIPNVKYIIYIYINDHLNRAVNPYRASLTSSKNPIYEINPLFEEIGDKIVYKEPSKLELLLYSFYTKKAYHYFYSQSFAREKRDEKFINYLIASKKITDEKFPNSKYIVIQYKDGGHCLMDDNIVNKLIENNFIVLDAEELAGHELESMQWRADDKEHPNAAAFKDVTEGLIKKLNLK